ncbi:WD repeat-containing protein DWA2 [Dendrobium catenatum]|uniref:WD repeat-containing protein DWA2 n=1 Tax=Dendrobium catenatum TaxID=906689 RepID=A0A2I0X652_9ASPA|nr:WD repeat-containing protein DWA2 [Dendrobium catenatum]
MQGGIVYGGLKYQARCIADVSADTDNTSFLAGTVTLKEENEVHFIRLSPYGTELVCEGLFYHPSEIWDLKSCPFDSRIFSTVFTSGETYGASIWEIPELYGQSNAPQLEELVSLKEHASKLKCILWWPRGRHDKVISIDEGNLFLWSIDSSSKTAKVLRKANSIENAHFRDVDYNPKKQHIIVTAEDESGIRIWDLRKPKFPMAELPGHVHWTWAVRYNPEYDDLILTAGTDSAVNLSIRLWM